VTPSVSHASISAELEALAPPALSAELVQALALDDEARIAIRSSPWAAHVFVDQTALTSAHLMPQAFWFFTGPLRDRFATISHYKDVILAGYLVDDDTDANHELLARTATELVHGLGLPQSAILTCTIDHSDQPPRPHLRIVSTPES
jgi:hypothetical protein